MPQKLKYKLEETFTPPEPRTEPKRYKYQYTEVRYEYYSGEVTANSEEEVRNMFYDGELDSDFDDAETVDTIDFEVEEL